MIKELMKRTRKKNKNTGVNASTNHDLLIRTTAPVPALIDHS